MNNHKPKIGDLIEQRFLLETSLGSGGFGSVWSASDQETGKKVAIKLLHTQLLNSPWILERFIMEATILKRLSHPRVAHCLHAGTTSGVAYMCIELVHGTIPLARARRRQRGLTDHGQPGREMFTQDLRPPHIQLLSSGSDQRTVASFMAPQEVARTLPESSPEPSTSPVDS